jgi:hypothetical protein
LRLNGTPVIPRRNDAFVFGQIDIGIGVKSSAPKTAGSSRIFATMSGQFIVRSIVTNVSLLWGPAPHVTSVGPDNAPVDIAEFGKFHCTPCDEMESSKQWPERE